MADDPETPADDPKETPKVEEPPTPEPPKDDFDKARAMATIQKQRDEEKRLKAELAEARKAKAELDAIKEKDLSEQEKLAKQAQEALAKAEAADSKLRRANLIAALADPSIGIVNARAAAKLIEGVEYDENGEPTNLGKAEEEGSLLAKFLADNEYLRGKAVKPTPPDLDGGAGGDKTPPALTADELEMAKASGMSPEEYAIFKKGGSLADLQEAGLKLEEPAPQT